MFDICIIGSGIVGSLIAQKLSKFECKVLILEKDNDVGNEASSSNSAIIHSGHDPKDNTLKAKLNLRGNFLWPSLAEELKIDYQQTGAFVVATDEDQCLHLQKLLETALNRGIKAEIFDKDQALANEPSLSDDVIQVLSLPSTGIITPWEACVSACEFAVDNGVQLKLNQKVIAIKKNNDIFSITTDTDIFESKIVINAAGIYSDQIYKMLSSNSDLEIMPRRGEYYVLDHSNHPIVSRVIYPLPNKFGKGVLVVPTIHNNILVGPNSERVDDREAKNTTTEALNFVREQASKTVKNLPFNQVIRSYSGLRASIKLADFIIEEAQDVSNLINCIGIDSPGLAAAPAIAEYVVDELLKDKIELNRKVMIKDRKAWIILNRLDLKERQAYVEQDSRFGRIVCRCEQISEAEIMDVINRNAGARSVKAIKHRCRPGAGRCQGGFCEPRVVEILARELHCDPTEVVLDSQNSQLLYKRNEDKE